jgi:hypothetical protein
MTVEKAQLQIIARSNIYHLYKQNRADIFDIMQKYKRDMIAAGLTLEEYLKCHEQAVNALNKEYELEKQGRL